MSAQLLLFRGLLRLAKPVFARASLDRVRRGIQSSPPSGIAGEDVTVAGVRCVWVAREQAAAGIVVYLHGGAYVTGPGKGHWRWLHAMCRDSGMAGVMVDYDLAPETVFPAALDQVMAVLAALRADSTGPIVLAGDSAGGGLAAAACLRTRDEGLPPVAAVLLISPWVDLTMTDPRGVALEKVDAMLSHRGLAQSAAAYAGGRDRTDPYLSPRFGDPTGLPPMFVHVGTREMFLAEDRDFAQRCRAAGVTVELVELKGGFHAAAVGVPGIPEANEAQQQMIAFVCKHVAKRDRNHSVI